MAPMCEGCGVTEALPGFEGGKLCGLCAMIGTPKRAKSADGLGSRKRRPEANLGLDGFKPARLSAGSVKALAFFRHASCGWQGFHRDKLTMRWLTPLVRRGMLQINSYDQARATKADGSPWNP